MRKFINNNNNLNNNLIGFNFVDDKILIMEILILIIINSSFN